MPPKAPRGGARGRGRPARGRGGAAVANTESQDVSMQDASIAESTVDTTMAETSNNDSTEPVQIKSEPEESASLASSSTMPPPPAPSGVKRTPSVRGGAKKSLIAQPKFAGRRSKAEREAAEATQAARRAEEAKAKARAERRGGLRGGRGGARGGFMGDFRRRESLGASGVFGSGVVSAEFSSGRRGPSRGIGGGGGGGGGPPPPGSRRRAVKSEGPDGEEITTYIELSSSDEEDEQSGPKLNIDHINLISDDEDNADASGAKTARKPRGTLPIRVPRVERKERGQPSASKASKVDGKRAMRNLEQSAQEGSAPQGSIRQPPPAERPWRGVYQDEDDEDDVAVKTEQQDDASTLQDPGSNLPAPVSPEDRKQRNRRQSAIDLQTEEERDEHQRRLDDLDTIVHELGQTTVADTDGDASMADDAAPKEDPRAYKVYLFQFPPILPNLQTNAQAVGKKSPSSSPTLTRAVPVKPDPDAAPEPTAEDAKPTVPSGKVGKLRVHESGKVTLDWAGTSLAVGMGTEVSFLQQVVMAQVFPDGRTERHSTGRGGRARSPTAEEREARSDMRNPPGVAGGEVMALGQVRGKFVVTPNWEEII